MNTATNPVNTITITAASRAACSAAIRLDRDQAKLDTFDVRAYGRASDSAIEILQKFYGLRSVSVVSDEQGEWSIMTFATSDYKALLR